MDDLELINNCISGDKKSWDIFVDQFTRLIYDSIIRTFRKYGAEINEDIVDDLHNEVFVFLLDNQYKTLKAFEGVEVPWFVDCGFANRIEAPAANAILDNKNIYTSEKTEAGYRLKVTDRKVEELYTFKAQMRRVIDGDTLLTEVDQGFGVWTEQRLRLRGIDTPEMSTLLGKKAKMWLENELKDLPFIVVKTYKSDQHDRYLVDVFYERDQSDAHRVAAEGIYLNDRLVREGLAQIWR